MKGRFIISLLLICWYVSWNFWAALLLCIPTPFPIYLVIITSCFERKGNSIDNWKEYILAFREHSLSGDVMKVLCVKRGIMVKPLYEKEKDNPWKKIEEDEVIIPVIFMFTLIVEPVRARLRYTTLKRWLANNFMELL